MKHGNAKLGQTGPKNDVIDVDHILREQSILQRYFEHNYIGMATTTPDKKWVHCNDELCRILGYSFEELQNKTWPELTHPEDLEKDLVLYNELLANKRDSFVLEKRYIKKDGGPVSTEISINCVRDGSGKIEYIVAFVLDISKRKEQELLLERHRRELAHAEKLSSLGEMAAGIAHEINNPLAIINGKIILLLKMLSKNGVQNIEKIIEHLNIMQETVKRITKIVRGFKTMARKDEDELFQEDFLKTVVDETLGYCNERIKSSGVELRLDINPSHKVYCQSVQLSQVLLNLLNNSIDAIEKLPNAWIEIKSWSHDNKTVHISVTDCGQGISKDVAEKMMRPFFTTKEKGVGTGLGLSVSSRIILQHQGTLKYNTESPHTQFIITLPLVSNDGQKVA